MGGTTSGGERSGTGTWVPGPLVRSNPAEGGPPKKLPPEFVPFDALRHIEMVKAAEAERASSAPGPAVTPWGTAGGGGDLSKRGRADRVRAHLERLTSQQSQWESADGGGSTARSEAAAEGVVLPAAGAPLHPPRPVSREEGGSSGVSPLRGPAGPRPMSEGQLLAEYHSVSPGGDFFWGVWWGGRDLCGARLERSSPPLWARGHPSCPLFLARMSSLPDPRLDPFAPSAPLPIVVAATLSDRHQIRRNFLIILFEL